MFDKSLIDDATRLLDELRARGMMIATAESCTGGLIAGLLTEIPGSSDVVDCGFMTYSNEAKQALVGVPANLLRHHGAVSAEVASAMAEGALKHAPRASISVAVTGVAGPGGGSDTKPVGLVHFGCAMKGQPTVHRERRFGDLGRAGIRLATVREALDLIRSTVNHQSISQPSYLPPSPSKHEVRLRRDEGEGRGRG
jgi:nicotinamide-nucleotide amidase